MAHEHTEIDLGPGVNVLTGPNNTGKSAVVEAIRCVATNPLPKHYIRHGAKEARVTVALSDGTRVAWIRKKRSSGYAIWHPGAEEPEEYWKFGRKPPEDVAALLKLDLVEPETGDSVDVHVGNQRSPIFLLDQPPSNAAGFFAASTESAHLLAMQNRLKQRTVEAKRKERELSDRLAGLETDLDGFAPLPGIALDMDELRAVEATLEADRQSIPAMEALLVETGKVQASLELNGQVMERLTGLREPERLAEVEGLAGMIHAMERNGAAVATTQEQQAVLAETEPVPETEPTRPLAEICEQIIFLEDLCSKTQKTVSITESLTIPSPIDDTKRLSDLLDGLLAHTYRGQRFTRTLDALEGIHPPPEVVADTRLEGVLLEMQRLTAAQAGVQSETSRLDQALEQLKTTIGQKVAAIGCCPTCGAEMTTDSFLEGRCSHVD